MRLTASERRMPRDSRIFGSTNSVNRGAFFLLIDRLLLIQVIDATHVFSDHLLPSCTKLSISEEVQLRAAAMSETSDPRPSSRRSVFDDGSESGRS